MFCNVLYPVLQMLNSFASDLDSILSDLSTSPTLRGSQELVGPDGGTSESHGVVPSCSDLETFSHSNGEDVVDSTDIPLLERLIRSHPIWYLPNLQRVAAAQLLQNQEQGVWPKTFSIILLNTPRSSYYLDLVSYSEHVYITNSIIKCGHQLISLFDHIRSLLHDSLVNRARWLCRLN